MTFARRRAAPTPRIVGVLLALAAGAAMPAAHAAECPALSARVAASTPKKLEVLTITAQPCVIKLMLYDSATPQAEEPLHAAIGRRPQYGSAEVAGGEVAFTVPKDFRGRSAFTVSVEGILDPVTIVIQASDWSSTGAE